MEQKTNDEFMRSILTEEAWRELSRGFNWSETLLEKYQNQVDWNEVSSNGRIQWTIPMLKKFANKINWERLSEDIEDDVLTPEMMEVFKDKWYWHELSLNWNLNFSIELLEKYADRLDWDKIISRHSDLYDGKGIDFYEKFREYIPASKLQGSRLWDQMVKQQKDALTKEIIS